MSMAKQHVIALTELNDSRQRLAFLGVSLRNDGLVLPDPTDAVG